MRKIRYQVCEAALPATKLVHLALQPRISTPSEIGGILSKFSELLAAQYSCIHYTHLETVLSIFTPALPVALASSASWGNKFIAFAGTTSRADPSTSDGPVDALVGSNVHSGMFTISRVCVVSYHTTFQLLLKSALEPLRITPK